MIRGWFPRRGRRNTDAKNGNKETVEKKKYNIRFFTFDALRIATNDFSSLLGRGGYGNVYKGVLPDDDGRRTVAVKKFTNHYNGFLEMVELISHIRHINLIQVIGCCVDYDQQLLVCEFAKNGSVWDHLHGEKAPFLDWERRASVCLGTARGLCYLHEEISPAIIHQDIKPSNIVLDSNFVPKIVDFDLIRVVGKGGNAEGETQTVSERNVYAHLGLGVEYWTSYTTQYLKGTLGYMDPDYLARGRLTEKADVYSFGLVMLEIITGRRPIDLTQRNEDDRMLLYWVTRMMQDGMVLNIVDPKLAGFPKDEVERFINVAFLCVQFTPEQRPTMFEVVHMFYGRHKFDREISNMATEAASAFRSFPAAISLSPTTSIGVACPAEMESRGDPVDETASGSHASIIVSNWTDVSESIGECSSSKAELPPLETKSAISSKEEQSCPENKLQEYFERSMDKIMRYHIMSQTVVINKPRGNTFMEAVYPPFLTAEYRRRPQY